MGDVTRDAASEHVERTLAREYWRCVGLAENARIERRKAEDVRVAFDAELKKWDARATEFLRLLGGKIPENPLPGSIETELADVS